MKSILVVCPVDAIMHSKTDELYLKILKKIGRVVFISRAGYLENIPCQRRIVIPEKYYINKNIVQRSLLSLAKMNFIKEQVCFTGFDMVVFFSYEPISMLLQWPKKKKVFVWEHNTIELMNKSLLRRLLFASLPKSVHSITLQDHINDYIQKKCKRPAHRITHPCFNDQVSKRGYWVSSKECGLKTVYCPTRDVDQKIQDDLISIASNPVNNIRVVARGNAKKSLRYEVIEFIENYEDFLLECDFVFIATQYNLRVSGVAYEALSFGKPVIIFECEFARELKNNFPNSVFIIKDTTEITSLQPDNEGVKSDHIKFLNEYSKAKLSKRITDILLNSDN